MNGKTDLAEILKSLQPELNIGDYVFCTLDDITKINLNDVISFFRENEAITIILKKELADSLKLEYTFVAAWITLNVHSSLSAVGLTAAFSKALSEKGISCNVVSAYYHDHIFVDKNDTEQAMKILIGLSE